MLLVVVVGVLLGTVVAFALRSGMAAADGLPPQAVEAAAAGLPAEPEPAMSDDAVAAGVEAEPSLIDQAAQ